MSYVPSDERRKLIEISNFVAARFDAGNWLELGLITGCSDFVRNHDRLLRSLRFGDDDYPGNCLAVLMEIVEREAANMRFIVEFIEQKFGETPGEMGELVSTAPSKGRKIVFSPSVFAVPDEAVDARSVAVMMPFTLEFEAVFTAIQSACARQRLVATRVKDIWEHQTIIQDVFSLIFRAQIVVCDFTGRNPNVFYEAGIAHTLGKEVIPLAQSHADVPFDVQHHRYLQYLNNGEGLAKMTDELSKRLYYLTTPADIRDLIG